MQTPSLERVLEPTLRVKTQTWLPGGSVISKLFKGSVRILAGLIAGLAIIFMLLVWQLSKGPISLGFLSPYIENAVNEDQTNFRLHMRDTILTWAGWDHSFDIRVLDVQIYNREDELISSIPELSFSLNRAALLQGDVAPDSIEIFGPTLRFVRQTDGTFNIGLGGAKDIYATSAIEFAQNLLDGPQGQHPLRHLARLHIIGADLTVDDQVLERSWMAPTADIRLARDDIGVHGQLSLILDVEGKQTELDLLARYKTADKLLEITADIDKLSLAPFAPVFDDVKLLENFHLPLKGNVGLSFPLGDGEKTVRFDIKGTAGSITLPPPYSEPVFIKSVSLMGEYASNSGELEIENVRLELAENQLQLPAPFSQTLNLKAGRLEGSYSAKTGIAIIKEFSGDLAASWNIELPDPINHKMPLRSFMFAGLYDAKGDHLTISNLNADLQGPTLQIKGSVSGARDTNTPLHTIFEMDMKDVQVGDTARYWPKTIANDAYSWITRHLSDGTLHQLTARGEVGLGTDGQMAVKSMGGRMQLSGVTVDYLPPMPKAMNVAGDIIFDAQQMKISLSQGKVQDLTLDQGEVLLSGLDQKDQFADIQLTIGGTVPAKLAFIDVKPLGFASEIGINPKSSSGEARTDLKLAFHLAKDLSIDEVKVEAKSSLTNVALANVILGRGIKDSTLELDVNNQGMTVTGEVVYEDIVSQLVWRENFGKDRTFQSRYDLNTTIKDIHQLEAVGLQLQHFSNEFLSGPIEAHIRFTAFDEIDKRLKVVADLTEAAMQAPAFGWAKAAGVKGTSQITIDLERDLVVDVPSFSIEAQDLIVDGAIRYANDGTGISEIRFDQLAYGRTDVQGALLPKDDGGWDVGLHGPSFDFSAYWEELFSGEPGDKGKESLLPNLTLAIEIDKIWVNDSQFMDSVSGTFSYVDEIWETFLLSSKLDSGASFDISIRPQADGNRQLTLVSDNAGETLRFLDAYETMQGGTLALTGTYDDSVVGHPLTGQLSVSDYRIVDAPVLAQILNIMALTGILDALSGDGIGFSSLVVPFVYHEGVLQISEARANGTSLGFTAEGRIFRYADVVDLKGTVVPAYALNSALGHIPLLGTLLTGGDKGGGVFAANYSMTGSLQEPDVVVNPLSALTPGFLRNVFGVFDSPDANTDFKPGEGLTITRP